MLLRRMFLARSAAAIVLAAGLQRARAGEPDSDFATWLDSFRAEAVQHGIRPATLDRAFAGLHPLDRVIELDQRQPERTITFAEYLDRIVTPRRIEGGRKRLADNAALLDQIGGHYGVQPRFIVALWAIETNFGAVTGNFSVVGSLATLAYTSSRPALFRAELLAALKIIDTGDIAPEDLKGSWAGAMGQPQFMPSSYLRYAVDYERHGHADIWNSKPDVFASIANYLSREGWDGNRTWGRRVEVPPALDHALLDGKTLRAVDKWNDLGVRGQGGRRLPRAAIPAGLVQPGGDAGPSLLVYDNYRVIMKWNHSTYFATAVSFLADSIEV